LGRVSCHCKKKKFNLKKYKQTNDPEEQEQVKEMVQRIKLDPTYSLKKELKLKLLVSEIATTQTTKDLRELISPFLSSLNLTPELGKLTKNFFKTQVSFILL
jgi:hypothetical protein